MAKAKTEIKISVILPSRDGLSRPLVKSIESLYSTISNKDKMEVLLALDEDDPSVNELRHYIDTNMSEYNIRPFVFKERYGYKNFHKYQNEIAKLAAGSWLLFWGDDQCSTTENWDLFLEKYEDKFVVLSPKMVGSPNKDWSVAPIVPKTWFDLLGHVSMNLHTDKWVCDMARELDMLVNIPFWVSISPGSGRHDFKGYESTLFQREIDMKKIKDYLNKNPSCRGKSFWLRPNS